MPKEARIRRARRVRRSRRGRPGESGYAYFFAMLAVLAMVVGSQVVVQNLATQSRREREAETIWRGNQWARAVRLYFHKTGHYPQSVDDLEKGVPDLHFLRPEAYKDPMNDTDGAWRFIYVNAGGQIIGSVRYATLQQMALIDLGAGAMPGGLIPGTPASSMTSTFGSSASSSAFSSGFSSVFNSTGNNSGGTSGTGQSSAVGGGSSNANSSSPSTNDAGTGNSMSSGSQQGGGSSSSTSSAPAEGSSSAAGGGSSSSPSGFLSEEPGGNGTDQSGQPQNPLLALKPTGPVDGPVIGAFITGVGSKVDRSSIKIYHGGKKYKDWEFIWNPLEDQARAMQQGLSNAQSGQTGIGQSVGAGAGGNAFGNSANSPGQGGMTGTGGTQTSPTSPTSPNSTPQ
jgi:hypothetical protein